MACGSYSTDMANQRESTDAGGAWESIFATRMRELRERANKSQASLADELWNLYAVKLDASAIARIEKNAHGPAGARLIRLGEAVAIANCLNSSMEEMLRPEISISERLKIATKRAYQIQEYVASAHANLDHLTEELRQQQEQVKHLTEQLVREDKRQELQLARETLYARFRQVRAASAAARDFGIIKQGSSDEEVELRRMIETLTADELALAEQLHAADERLMEYDESWAAEVDRANRFSRRKD